MYKKIKDYIISTPEMISFQDYIDNYQYTSDITGANVDVCITDSSYDIMHYEFRDNIQLVDWGYLLNNPNCTFEEWRAQDVTYEELNSTIARYFQEILDDAVSQGGLRAYHPEKKRMVTEWSPFTLSNYNYKGTYSNKLKRDGLDLRLGHYMTLQSVSSHGTNCLSNIVGKTTGLAKDAHIYLWGYKASSTYKHNKDLGIANITPAALLAQCKQRSGIRRPTIHSMSLGITGDPNLPARANMVTNLNVAPIIPSAVSQSSTVQGTNGDIEITIPDVVKKFCEIATRVTASDANTLSGIDSSKNETEGTPIVFEYSGSLRYDRETLLEQNEIKDYIEKTFNLSSHLNYLQSLNTKFYDDADFYNEAYVQTINLQYGVHPLPRTIDDQLDKDSYDVFYDHGGHSFRSAGNSHFNTDFLSNMEARKKYIDENFLGGFANTLAYESASLINTREYTLKEGLTPTNEPIIGVRSTSNYNYLDTLKNLPSKGIIERSGSLTPHTAIGYKWPKVWRVKPVWSNIGLKDVWDDGTTSFISMSESTLPLIATSSEGYILFAPTTSSLPYMHIEGTAVENTRVDTFKYPPPTIDGTTAHQRLPMYSTASITLEELLTYNEQNNQDWIDGGYDRNVIGQIKGVTGIGFPYLPATSLTLYPGRSYFIVLKESEDVPDTVSWIFPHTTTGIVTQSIALTERWQSFSTYVNVDLPPHNKPTLASLISSSLYNTSDPLLRSSDTKVNIEYINETKGKDATQRTTQDPENITLLANSDENGIYTSSPERYTQHTSFPSNGVFITGSYINNTLPRLQGMVNTDIEDLSTLEDSDDQVEIIEGARFTDDLTIKSYHANDAYNIAFPFQCCRLHPAFSVFGSHPDLYEINEIFDQLDSDSSNINTLVNDTPEKVSALKNIVDNYNYIGLLLHPYDDEEQIIDNEPLMFIHYYDSDAHLGILPDTETEFKLKNPEATSPLNSYYTVNISKMRDGEVPSASKILKFHTLLSQNLLYYSASVNIERNIPPIIPQSTLPVTNSFGDQFELDFIYGEDIIDPDSGLNLHQLFKQPWISEIINFDKKEENVSDLDLFLTRRANFGNSILVLKERPGGKRDLIKIKQPYSPIRLSGYPAKYDLDERANTVGASTLVRGNDPTKTYVSGTFHFPGSYWTSSVDNVEYKHFFTSQSGDDQAFADAPSVFSNKGNRVSIWAPGSDVLVAEATNNTYTTTGVTLLDYFNTGSDYYRYPFLLASCSFDNMRDSNNNTIPELGFMTSSQAFVGDFPMSFGRTAYIANREMIDARRLKSYSLPIYEDSTGRLNLYKYTGGTSFSCPLTAGVAALWLDLFPELTQLELRAVMQASSYRGAFREENLFGPDTVRNINDFDRFLFGISSNVGISNSDYPSQIPYFNVSSSGTHTREYYHERINSDLFSSSYQRFFADPTNTFNIENGERKRKTAEQRFRRYLLSYSDFNRNRSLYGAFNGVAHWPFSKTNRSEITGSINNLSINGVMTLLNSTLPTGSEKLNIQY